ncbi:MAG: histidinol dehydrogenase, partial [Blastocatellia bacterium]
MIEIIQLAGSGVAANEKLRKILNRGIGLNNDILTRTDAILREVRERGDEALIEFTERFDGVKIKPESLRVDRDAIEELAAQVDDDLIAAMREAIANIRHYHEHQLTTDWE